MTKPKTPGASPTPDGNGKGWSDRMKWVMTTGLGLLVGAGGVLLSSNREVGVLAARMDAADKVAAGHKEELVRLREDAVATGKRLSFLLNTNSQLNGRFIEAVAWHGIVAEATAEWVLLHVDQDQGGGYLVFYWSTQSTVGTKFNPKAKRPREEVAAGGRVAIFSKDGKIVSISLDQ